MMDDLLSGSGLTIIINFESLADYVSLLETRKLVDDFELEVRWLPLLKSGQDNSPKLIENDALSGYKARRALARDKFAKEELERNSGYMDIAVEQAGKEFDATFVAQGLLWLNEVGVGAGDYWRYMDRIFEEVFRENRHVETGPQIQNLLQETGIDVTGFADFLDKNNLPAVQEMLLENGIFESPAIVYQGERYIGRQHHPLLRWIFGGRKGTPPV
jgi:predicted DsbA family dithiol-disulfide isomerase